MDGDVRVRVGRALRRHRLAKGLSQEEFADLCGLDRTYISGIERSLRNPTVVVLERMATVLGIPSTALLEVGIDDDPTLVRSGN